MRYGNNLLYCIFQHFFPLICWNLYNLSRHFPFGFKIQDAALQIEELLDKLSVSFTGEELEVVGKLYHQAMKLEVEFFSAQPVVQPTVVPLTKLHDPNNRLVIFSDFDLTCTLVDSSTILAEIAILSAPKVDQSETNSLLARKSSSDMRNLWGALSKQYTEEYKQCMESILSSEEGIWLLSF